MAAKKKQEEATDKKERCPKCNAEKFSIAEDVSEKRYCQVCHHVWLPMNKAEIENSYLNEEVLKLRSENKKLKEENEKLRKALPNQNENTQEGIFS